MKKFLLFVLCLSLLTAFSVAAADDGGYKVTYYMNNCLAEVPQDEKVYQYGEEVTVLFEPVQYTGGLIFYGWDMNDDGIADFGYAYRNFIMPNHDVKLKAICITPYYGEADTCPQPCNPPHHHHHPGPFHPQRPQPRPVPGFRR